jgi:hypothetical protein
MSNTRLRRKPGHPSTLKEDAERLISICIACIGDLSLRKIARLDAAQTKCSYCGKRRLGTPMDTLAKIVDEPLRTYCRIGEEVPVFHGDSDSPDYEQEGDSLVDLLQMELNIEYDAAEDLAGILQESDPADPRDGEKPFYHSENNYHRRYIYASDYTEEWEAFSHRVKHQRRFFDDAGRLQLAEILGSPGDAKAAELPVMEIGPETRVLSVYRARRADTEDKARQILQNPVKELGPPPAPKATAGRMNPAGISVFYGALSEETATAEVRPSVGSLVVVGGFDPCQKLKLLNLSQIGVGFTGSIFDPGYEDRAARRRFLEGFHTLIARPIQPHDEVLEYIPTQAVAEYVANVLGLDGILYASAQVGAVPEVPEPSPYVITHELSNEELAEHNVVLFGEAATVGQSAADIQKQDQQGENHPQSASLSFRANSAHAVRVKAVKYTHERAYVPDDDRRLRFPLFRLGHPPV